MLLSRQIVQLAKIKMLPPTLSDTNNCLALRMKLTPKVRAAICMATSHSRL
jgi:hypothetical protein